MEKKTAKQQAIEKAFGDKWHLFTPEYQEHLLTKKHWVDMSVKYGALSGKDYYRSPTPQRLGFMDEIEINFEFWRPKSLQGIETNNGWFRIESEEDLPRQDGEYRCFTKKRNISEFTFLKNATEKWWMDRITHYKPIEPELLPIY